MQILGGLILLTLGGQSLVRGAAQLALRLGLTPLVVGLTVVAFGTSSPELFVSLKAATSGHSEIAVGNVVGSNIGNIGAILALCALVFPLRVSTQVLRLDMPIVLGVSVTVVIMLGDSVLARWEAALLACGLIVYTLVVLRLARQEKQAAVEQEFSQSMPIMSRHPVLDVAFLLTGFLMLGFGSRFLVDGASDIARSFGLSDAVIGLTIVAFGTSLPELSASLAAAFRKEADIAVGNLVGSNLFNLMCILGISGTITPLEAGGITAVDLGVMVGFAIVLLPLMRTDFVIQRWEGAVLAVTYTAYLMWLTSQNL